MPRSVTRAARIAHGLSETLLKNDVALLAFEPAAALHAPCDALLESIAVIRGDCDGGHVNTSTN